MQLVHHTVVQIAQWVQTNSPGVSLRLVGYKSFSTCFSMAIGHKPSCPKLCFPVDILVFVVLGLLRCFRFPFHVRVISCVLCREPTASGPVYTKGLTSRERTLQVMTRPY